MQLLTCESLRAFSSLIYSALTSAPVRSKNQLGTSVSGATGNSTCRLRGGGCKAAGMSAEAAAADGPAAPPPLAAAAAAAVGIGVDVDVAAGPAVATVAAGPVAAAEAASVCAVAADAVAVRGAGMPAAGCSASPEEGRSEESLVCNALPLPDAPGCSVLLLAASCLAGCCPAVEELITLFSWRKPS